MQSLVAEYESRQAEFEALRRAAIVHVQRLLDEAGLPGELRLRQKLALVAMVGAGVTRNPLHCHRFWQQLKGQPVEFTWQSEEGISLVAVLRAGKLQQVDTPANLYDHPANEFVAGFIGSPAMNLIEGVVDGEGDQPAARLKDGTAIRIAATRKVKRGQPVTIGLRPEHIGSTVGGDISLSGRTVLVEPTGAQTHVVFELAGDQVTAVVDGEQLVKVNTPFAATVHHERVHVFDRASGLAL